TVFRKTSAAALCRPVFAYLCGRMEDSITFSGQYAGIYTRPDERAANRVCASLGELHVGDGAARTIRVTGDLDHRPLRQLLDQLCNLLQKGPADGDSRCAIGRKKNYREFW